MLAKPPEHCRTSRISRQHCNCEVDIRSLNPKYGGVHVYRLSLIPPLVASLVSWVDHRAGYRITISARSGLSLLHGLRSSPGRSDTGRRRNGAIRNVEWQVQLKQNLLHGSVVTKYL
ncbi:hypothetical protein CY34DRAFT_798193 [Suillus luteus UH-Slu-Lm8-n1]|uniref:Uncharacterized protein n=1 Tax=Suillus luteus UH-Slu-Lm8-n1 TaxID=930992 RepID=A0A0D0BF54_9AGAM|nr:hypothetical protein CY34DRAFT_798193 [Suillus luteus UH-Slu-Lm8-n1]